MSDRIDQYLEGTLNRDELADERPDADAAVRAISDTRAFIGARPAPDVTAAVMQRVKHGPHDERARARVSVARVLLPDYSASSGRRARYQSVRSTQLRRRVQCSPWRSW